MSAIELIAEVVLSGDSFKARSLVQNWTRSHPEVCNVPPATSLDPTVIALAASLAELFARRFSQPAPSCTRTIDSAPVAIYLVPSALRMKNLKALCDSEGPAELRRRNFFAPPGYLSQA